MRRLALLLLSISAFAADEPAGAQLYKKHCAMCHDAPASSRIPAQAALRERTSGNLLQVITSGMMRQQGAALSGAERRLLTNWLGKSGASVMAAGQLANRCPAPTSVAPPGMPSWNGWGADLSNSRFQTPRGAGLSAEDIPRLQLKWAFAVPGATTMRSQPAVYGGRVFLGTADGIVYSLDAATGCTHWATEGAAQVRTAPIVAPLPGKELVIYGEGSGRLVALDASDGRPAWQLSVDSHPAAVISGTPTNYQGRLYLGVASFEESVSISPGYRCCTFRGSVMAVDAASGKIVWKSYTIAETPKPGKRTRRGAATTGPSGAGVWTAPTLDPENGVLYVATGDNYSDPPTSTSDAVLAFNMQTGKLQWSTQFTKGDAYNSTCALPDKANCPDSDGPDHDFAASPVLVRLPTGKRVLVLGQKSGMLHAVDPDAKGKILWQSRVGKGGILGGIQWGFASDGARVYVALSDLEMSRNRAPGTNDVVRQLDPTRGGGMFAFQVDNGERLWMTPPPGCGDRRPCSPAQSAAVSGIPGAVFSGSVDGHLRAYAVADGKIIWDYDTVRPYTTVNGVPGQGGALDAGGPVIAGGMLFVNSGYGWWSGLPGNVLLAFAIP